MEERQMKKQPKTANLSLKLEPKLKERIEVDARKLDMSTSAFIRLCYRVWEEKRDSTMLLMDGYRKIEVVK
jgi:hypothetical protein